jgi:hypothetical protein
MGEVTMETTKPEKWGYYIEGRNALGPFDSKEEAMEDAKECYPGEKVIIGKCQDVIPSHFVDIDIDLLLEQADERFADEVFTEDPIFEIDGKGNDTEAADELRALVKRWADRWIVTNMNWYVSASSEEIKIATTHSERSEREER